MKFEKFENWKCPKINFLKIMPYNFEFCVIKSTVQCAGANRGKNKTCFQI